MSDSPVAVALDAAPAAAPRKTAFDSRYLAPVFVTLILLVGQISFGVLESYPKTLLAIGTAIVTEIVLCRVTTGKFPHLASAYITGISVGMIIRSPEWWPYLLASMISITSKYVIRVHGRHLWNPSNFGISVLLFCAPQILAPLSIQWDNRLWATLVIWAVGSIIIARLKRFHICAVYVVSFLALAYVRSLITGQAWLTEISPITGPPYQLFIFFMITDPKTTVQSKRGQMATAFAVAVAECILRLGQSVHAPYYALFLVGPVANWIEIQWRRDRAGH